MALVEDIVEFLKPPFFLPGDPRREWHFTFMLAAPHYYGGDLPAGLTFGFSVLFGSLALLYVSGLAEKVMLPASKFVFEQSPFSTLQVPFPKGFDMPTIQVQYLEDDWGLVGLFHRIWQSSIKGYFKGIKTEEGRGDTGSDGVVFEELGKVCATAIYAPARMNGDMGPQGYGAASGIGFRLETPHPLGLEVWPAVFPVEISSDAANRGGNNLAKVTVTYARIPVWSMRGNIYEWRGDGDKSVVVPGAFWPGGKAEGVDDSGIIAGGDAGVVV